MFSKTNSGVDEPIVTRASSIVRRGAEAFTVVITVIEDASVSANKSPTCHVNTLPFTVGGIEALTKLTCVGKVKLIVLVSASRLVLLPKVIS